MLTDMMTRSATPLALVLAATRGVLGASSSASTAALPEPTAIDLVAGTGVVGALHRPAPGGDPNKAATAVMVMHAEQDYWSFYPCTELPKRGYTVLCANNDASKSGYMSDLNFEDMMTDAGYAIQYLRNQTDIDNVIIFGHSGGGALLSQYQNVAENGIAACNGPEKIYPCSDAMAGLPAADGLILDDANFGIGPMTVMSLNPALEDMSSGMAPLNETLDLFNVANGWNSTGSSDYSPEFEALFSAGVHAINTKLIAYAQSRLAAINNGTGLFSDDEPFYVPDALYTGNNNKFFNQDVSYLHHTTYPWKLVHKGGNYTVQIVPSVRVPSTVPSINTQYLQGGLKTTIKRFLSTIATTTTPDYGYQVDGVSGIVWNSSQMTPISAIQGVRVPLLTLGNTGHYEMMNIEKTHLAAVSNDTDIAFIEGAQHTIDTCTECETYPGEYGDTVKTTFDYVDQWISKPGRFF